MSRTVEAAVGSLCGTALIGVGLWLVSWWFIVAGVSGLAIAAARATEDVHAQ